MKQPFDKQTLLFWGTVALALISVAAYLGILSLDLRNEVDPGVRIQTILGWFAVAMVAYVGLVWWQEHHQSWHPSLVWGSALLFHGLLICSQPTLSSDVYRYLWDGHVANQGVSPYAFAIDAPELDSVSVPVRDLANHTWMASPYLPAAQWLFYVVTFVFPLAPIYMQLTMSALSIGNGVLIGQLLQRTGLPARRIVLYLWNPLIVVEVAHGAHVDAWMVLLVLGAILAGWQAARKGELTGAILLALAILTKIIPILLVPLLGRRWSWFSWIVLLLAGFIPILWAALRAGWGLLGPLDGTGVFGALRIYSAQWDFNSGIYRWLRIFLSTRFDVFDAERVAKLLVALALLTFVLWAWHRVGSSGSFRHDLRSMSIPFMGYILLTTTVHPWYLVPVLALLPFWTPAEDEPQSQWFTIVPWLYLSGVLMLSYLTYVDPDNLRELTWVRRIEWIPMLMGLAIVWLVPKWSTSEPHNRNAA